MGRKVEGGAAVPLWGELGPHLTQCRLGRGLPLYQVASSSIQPFGHNRHGLKSVGLLYPFRGGAGSPSNTMSPVSRPISVPSGWRLDPSNRLVTIHQRYKTDRQDRQRSDSIG